MFHAALSHSSEAPHRAGKNLRFGKKQAISRSEIFQKLATIEVPMDCGVYPAHNVPWTDFRIGYP
jgi:hypothetical protein